VTSAAATPSTRPSPPCRRSSRFVFTLAGPVDAHHQQARFTWGLGPAGAEPLIVGFDVLATGADDKIDTVLGFLDKVPG
jgi:hypothetical protein